LQAVLVTRTTDLLRDARLRPVTRPTPSRPRRHAVPFAIHGETVRVAAGVGCRPRRGRGSAARSCGRRQAGARGTRAAGRHGAPRSHLRRARAACRRPARPARHAVASGSPHDGGGTIRPAWCRPAYRGDRRTRRGCRSRRCGPSRGGACGGVVDRLRRLLAGLPLATPDRPGLRPASRDAAAPGAPPPANRAPLARPDRNRFTPPRRHPSRMGARPREHAGARYSSPPRRRRGLLSYPARRICLIRGQITPEESAGVNVEASAGAMTSTTNCRHRAGPSTLLRSARPSTASPCAPSARSSG
jgi:hypothetical protein